MSHFALVYNTDVEERIKRVREYAAEHVYEPPPAPDHVTNFGVMMMVVARGTVRDVRCIYTHTRMPAPIAKLFGFDEKCMMGPHECECSTPCPPNVVCGQELSTQ